MAWFHMVSPATSHLVSDKLCLRHLACINSRLYSATCALFHKRPCRSPRTISFSIQVTQMSGSEITRTEQVGKNVFVCRYNRNTRKRIFEKLVAKGFVVIVGVRDVDKAKSTFSDNPSRQIVKDGVTEDVDQLVVGDDSDAFVCAIGFKLSLDLLAPWKVNHIMRELHNAL